MEVQLAAEPVPLPPASPLGDAIVALDDLTEKEKERFYASLDQLPNFDSPRRAESGFGYTIDEEDWQWLTKAVGTKTPQELAQFAHDEAERMTFADPELAELAQLGAATAEELGGDASLEEQLAGIQQLTRFAEHFDCGTPAGSGDTNPFAPGASSAAKRRAEEAGLEGSSAEADEESKGKGKKPRERGTAWTEEEHKNFLIGLERYGKGDWRSISRQCVLTRTPAQVASHAQKYFIRQEAPIEPAKKANRRVSIHDINSLDQTMPARNQRKRRKAERAAAHAAAVAAATKGGPPPDVSAVSAATPSTAASGATVASQSAAVAASPDVAAAAAAAAAAISAAAPAAAAAITAAAPAVLEVPGAGDKVGPGGPSSDCNGDSPSESGGSAPGSATGGSQPNSLPGSALSSPAKLEGEGAGAAPAAQATVESSA